MSLQKRSQQATMDEHKEKKWLRQLYLNKVLERVMPRTVKYVDNNGDAIPKPRTYNRLDEKTKKKLNKSITRSYRVGKGEVSKKVEIDAGISELVTRLWDVGIRTNACCSGMVADHPYERFESNDRFGEWKKGDLVKIHSGVTSAYLSVPYKWNHPELMKYAEEKANGWKWTTDRGRVYGEESLIFYPPHCLDGTTWESVLLESSDLRESFLKSGEAADDEQARRMAIKLVEKNHGGAIRYTDKMLGYNFRVLCEGMADMMSRILKEERKNNIDEGKAVNIYIYDNEVPELTPQQLKAVFDRAGIELDMESINRPVGRYSQFIVHQGQARMAAEDEPRMPGTMVNETHNLSYLMAQQIKGTPSVSNDKMNITIMLHPDPQSMDVSRQFTVTKNLSEYNYYHYFVNEGDLNQFFSYNFAKELYQAAQHAYDNSLQKKIDDIKPQMAVSDIRIRKGMDNNWYISCKVFGEQQLSKRLNTTDTNYYRMRMLSSDKAYNGVAEVMARKYYEEEIELAEHLQQKDEQGMKI